MKECPYCGTQYADSLFECPIDDRELLPLGYSTAPSKPKLISSRSVPPRLPPNYPLLPLPRAALLLLAGVSFVVFLRLGIPPTQYGYRVFVAVVLTGGGAIPQGLLGVVGYWKKPSGLMIALVHLFAPIVAFFYVFCPR